MPTQNPGTARNRMLMKREILSPKLFGRSALTIATGMPTIQDSTTEMQRDLGGQRAAPQHHVGDALGAEERVAETAASDVAHPVQILHDQRIAEPEIAPCSWRVRPR